MLAIAAYRFNKIDTIKEHSEVIKKYLTENKDTIHSSELDAYKKTLLEYKRIANKLTIQKELTEETIESLLDKISKAQG